MNKLTKVGCSALCGSLAAISAANAGDLTVTGGADMTWTSIEGATTGNPIGIGSNYTLSGSGELDNGWGVALSIAATNQMAYSNTNVVVTVPSIGDEVAVQTTNEDKEVAKQQEVSVETFTVQEPESPPLPVTVFEPYMIKRGDFLTKIALREYGDASMWQDIYSWNKDEIGDNPDRLYPYNFLSLKRESNNVRDCEPEFFDYTIQSGDTAWNLAQRVYGDELAWVIIYVDNANLIKSTDGILQPGSTFKMRKKLDPCN